MVTERFSRTFNGYNIEEVNDFVDEMTKKYEELLNKLHSKEKEIDSLKLKLDSREIKTYKNEVPLVQSQNFNNNGESLKIINDAKRNASRIINDALMEAERLESKKEALRQELITLKRKARANLQVQLQSLDDLDDLL